MGDKNAAYTSSFTSGDAAYDAWDQQRDEFMKPIDGICQAAFEFGEKLEDESVAVQSALPFFGTWLAENHCKHLDAKAKSSEENGRQLASDHYLKREMTFASWTLGYDHEITTRVRKELEQRDPQNHPFGFPAKSCVPPFYPRRP